jgi:hypothetical protein
MASYKIASERLAGFTFGETVTEEQLEGVNIPALVESGHLEAVTTKPTKADKE